MKLLEKILLPVDVNAGNKEQLNTAKALARSYNSEIVLMYVLSKVSLPGDIKEILTGAISSSLNEIRDNLIKDGISVKEPVIEYGEPVAKIIQTADKENVNLILAGSGDKDEKEKFKLGTTAEKLVRQSDRPVWVVKPGDKSKISNILCPVDFSDASKRALKNAIVLSKNFKSKLRILFVYEPVTSVSSKLKIDLEKENAFMLNQFKSEVNQFIQEFELKEVDHEIDIQAGSAPEKILQTISKHGHDLLVMGTSGRSTLNRLVMGSVTEKVTREMPCSFVTTKTQDIIQLKFDNEIKEIEIHFKNATDLLKNGYYEEAINQFMICLHINDMHIPSIYKLAEVYRTIGYKAKAEYYDNMAKDLLARIWDKKIEEEIRKHYKTGK